jgi:major type 1 subunit fimbrin (pilin)
MRVSTDHHPRSIPLTQPKRDRIKHRVSPKRVLVCLSFIAGLLLAAHDASAADGVVYFDGEISDTTCQINGLDKKADLTVKLPKVNSSALAADGETAGLTSFTLKLTGCKISTGSVYPHFLYGATIDPQTSRLKNAATGLGDARNVEVALLNEDLSPIDLARDAGEQNVLKAELIPVTAGEPATTTGEATLKFFAQYVATGGAAIAGAVHTNVLYAMVYP